MYRAAPWSFLTIRFKREPEMPRCHIAERSGVLFAHVTNVKAEILTMQEANPVKKWSTVFRAML